MSKKPDVNSPGAGPDSEEYAQVLDTIPESEPTPQKDTRGEFLFQVFCAVIFLGMIGLVFYNAMLRYVSGFSFMKMFNLPTSYPPSEEWARFLFIYITFFGAIEAFYRKKHIAVDMFVDLLHGGYRQLVEVCASLLGMAAMFLLLWGGIENVLLTYDTYSIATNINMTFIYATLPIMAAASLLIQFRDFIRLLRQIFSDAVRREVEIQIKKLRSQLDTPHDITGKEN